MYKCRFYNTEPETYKTEYRNEPSRKLIFVLKSVI